MENIRSKVKISYAEQKHNRISKSRINRQRKEANNNRFRMIKSTQLKVLTCMNLHHKSSNNTENKNKPTRLERKPLKTLKILNNFHLSQMPIVICLQFMIQLIPKSYKEQIVKGAISAKIDINMNNRNRKTHKFDFRDLPI